MGGLIRLRSAALANAAARGLGSMPVGNVGAAVTRLCRHHAAWHMAQVLQCVPLSLWPQWSALGAVAQCVALLLWAHL